jgi:hypothetical protein
MQKPETLWCKNHNCVELAIKPPKIYEITNLVVYFFCWWETLNLLVWGDTNLVSCNYITLLDLALQKVVRACSLFWFLWSLQLCCIYGMHDQRKIDHEFKIMNLSSGVARKQNLINNYNIYSKNYIILNK